MSSRGSLKRRLARADAGEVVPKAKAKSADLAQGRGSLRRRLERAGVRDLPAGVEDGPLTDILKRRWASGQLSSVIVQEIASGAERQGAIDMSGLSGAGAGGRHAQNLQRSLFTVFEMPPAAAYFTWVRIPTSRGVAVHPAFLPHECF